MPDVVTNDIVYVNDGETVSDLVADANGEIDVLAGGTLTDSLATNEGMIFVDPGATVLRTSASEMGYICVDGDATDLTAETAGAFDIGMGGTLDTGLIKSGGIGTIYSGGSAGGVTVLDNGVFLNYGGTVQDTNVMSGGSFTVQGATAITSTTSVLDGGVMRIIEGGNATDTTITSGSLSVVSGSAAKTVVTGGTMYVYTGNTVTETTLNDGELTVDEASADTTVQNGGVMEVFYGTLSGTTVNDGQFTMEGGTLTDTAILGGSAIFTKTDISGITIGNGGTITVDSGSTLGGVMDFVSGASISIDGTIAFDTAFSTAEKAQISGFSVATIGENACYTLTDEAGVKGKYKLASDAAGFNGEIIFSDLTLTVGGAPIIAGDIAYSVAIVGTDLVLRIGDIPNAKCDIDNNGISEVMFQHTAGSEGQIGFWMNGTNEWRSTDTPHLDNSWKILGAYDMSGDDCADTLMISSVTSGSGKDVYIGYYLDSVDTDDNWRNLGHASSAENVAWQNSVGNLTGNKSKNSIVWYAPERYSLGAWIDGTEDWVTFSVEFGSDDWTLVGCGDFDGDGKDSVLMNYNHGQCFYTADLDGVTQALGSAIWDGWEVRAIGDFSDDGMDDLILYYKDTGSIVMCADGNTDSYVSIGQIDTIDWFVAGAGDYNGDGMDDLLLRQYSTGMLGYYVSADQSQWVTLGDGVDMNWNVIA